MLVDQEFRLHMDKSQFKKIKTVNLGSAWDLSRSKSPLFLKLHHEMVTDQAENPWVKTQDLVQLATSLSNSSSITLPNLKGLKDKTSSDLH